MYSVSSNPVDKGLGFDFSAITDLVKSALPVGMNVYQQQMQLRQTKALAQQIQQGGYGMPSAGQYVQLPMSQALQPQPTFGNQYVQPRSSGMDMSTMLVLGVGAVGALLVIKKLMQ